MPRLNITEVDNCSECPHNFFDAALGQLCSKGCKDWNSRYCPEDCPLPEASDVITALLKEVSK